ncbi:MAG: hypothetical protein RIT33_993, partial [Pseudomonadota bacterium]
KLKESLEQVFLIVLGVALVLFISELSHLGHSH